ncbi:MAG TPA: helix-turn-helix domain-containing protein [Pyrinomonadaceae bacterium]|jgi:excisionase family DNA binding protein
MRQIKSKLMSEPQMARWLNISIATLRRARQAGKIRFYRVGKWRVLYSEDQGQEFLTEHCQPVARPNVRTESQAA